MSSSHSPKSTNPASEAWDWLIGEITAPSGLHGEVRVFPHTDFPERFATLAEVGVRQGETVRIVPVRGRQVTARRIVLKLEGIDTIEAAEALRGAHLVVSADTAMPLDEGQYYHDQILGLAVVTTAGESLGPITRIITTGANDVYETPEALIPAVKEFIREIDLSAHRMLVEARPGLKKSDPGS
jgi:16S rRNA processing protein RimM